VSVYAINETIRAMCREVSSQATVCRDWKFRDEDDLFYEVTFCICSSQASYEVASATANVIRNMDLVGSVKSGASVDGIRDMIVSALDSPMEICDVNGCVRFVRPRFRNRIAQLIANTIDCLYARGATVRELLVSAENPKHAREVLTQHVCGFGPKQASLYLRRIGYCNDLAVLDVHIIDYLRVVHGMSIAPAKLSKLSFYEELENVFRNIARSFGHSLGCVDLATWLTMRVLKREALI